MRKSISLLVVVLVLGLAVCAKQAAAEQPQTAADQTRAEELFQLGEKWATADHGKGTQDWNKALEYYRQAAELGHSGAMVCLGDCYALGIGIKKDVTEAIVWYYKAAELENPAAFWGLKEVYRRERRENDYCENQEETKQWRQRYEEFCKAQKDPTDPVVQYLLGTYFRSKEGQENRDAMEKWFRKSAEQGYAPAQYVVAHCCGGGPEAMEWFHKAAEQGFAQAQHVLGDCYKDGRNVEKDEVEAAKWYRKAAEQGDASAQISLGDCCKDGAGVEKNEHEAVEWYRKAAEQGYVDAQCRLGRCYVDGIGVEKNEREGVNWLRKAAMIDRSTVHLVGFEAGMDVLKKMAKQGNAVAKEAIKEMADQGHDGAQCWLGRCCEDGTGVEKDENEAVKWYRKAAENGSHEAMMHLESLMFKKNTEAVNVVKEMAKNGNHLAWLCLENWANLEDDVDAVVIETMQEVAEKGILDAQCWLGDYYASEDDASYDARDSRKAAEWFLKAAEQGNRGAQCELGDFYAKGFGVEKDEREAVKWYRKAAEQGSTGAQIRLARCYANGTGVEKDEREAVNWCRKAGSDARWELKTMAEHGSAVALGVLKEMAEQGKTDVQLWLGNCCKKGTGVEKNEAEAAKWYRKAAEQGSDDAMYYLAQCYANGTGVEKNLSKAIEWYRKAAEERNDDAMCELGRCYAEGVGVEQNEKQAVEWYLRASEYGDTDARAMLEEMVGKGSKIAKKALKERAGQAGKGWAQCRLGNCYAKGLGMKKDEAKAVKWYRRAMKKGEKYEGRDAIRAMAEKGSVPAKEAFKEMAEQGDDEAQCWLGHCYADGTGVERDEVEAVKWFRKAAEQKSWFDSEGFSSLEEMAKKGSTAALNALKEMAEQGNAAAKRVLKRVSGEIDENDDKVRILRSRTRRVNFWK